MTSGNWTLERCWLVLSRAATASMWQVTARGRRYDLGLSWFRPASQRDADPPFVEHLSGGAGFFNVIRIYPSRGVGVAVMGNATSYHIDTVARLAPDDRLRDPGTRPRRS